MQESYDEIVMIFVINSKKKNVGYQEHCGQNGMNTA